MIMMLKINGGINKTFNTIEDAVDFLCCNTDRNRETTKRNLQKALKYKKYVYNNYRWREK